jgi:hypothetical protein
MGIVWIGAVIQATAEPAIIKGYGKTEWGQSVEETKAVIPEIEMYRESGSYSLYRLSNDEGPIKEIVFQYYEDNLYFVTVKYSLPDRPEEGQDEIGYEIMKEMIERKYYEDEDTKRALQEASIRISPSAGYRGHRQRSLRKP